jgi:hypothetical protein
MNRSVVALAGTDQYTSRKARAWMSPLLKAFISSGLLLFLFSSRIDLRGVFKRLLRVASIAEA